MFSKKFEQAVRPMSENVENAALQMLIRIQEQIAAFRQDTEQRFGVVETRLDRIEEINRKQRRDSAGMLVMMRATAGDFDERVSEVEERVAALEAGERL
jgi:hypothetical protein